MKVTDADTLTFTGDFAFSGSEWISSRIYQDRTEEYPCLAMMGKVLIHCDQETEAVVIPEYTKHIASDAFSECGDVRTLSIPENAFTCPEFTFDACVNVEHLSYT